MTSSEIISLVTIIIFALAMIVVGVLSQKRAQTLDNFLLGGRKIGPWLSAFSYGTSYFSAVVFIGYAGTHGWRVGMGSLWIGVGNAVIGTLLAWLVLGRRTRDITQKLDAKTMPDFFAKRYLSTPMKVYTALIIFIFLVPYAASVYKGLGTLFSAVFVGASELTCMLIVAIITAIYLVLGGYIASAINNFIQGMIMLIGVVVIIVILLAQPEVNGISGMVSGLSNISTELTDVWGGKFGGFLLTNILLTSFGTWGLPQMVHKYYAIKDSSSIKIGAIIATVFAVVIGCGAYFIGSMSHLFIEAGLDNMPAISGGYDAIVPYILTKVFSATPALNIVLAIMLVLLLSASMSTLSSLVITSASSVAVDMMSVVKPQMENKKEMTLMRLLCVLFVALSFFFATQNISFIVNLMSFSWGVVAGAFLGPYLWGLYSDKITKFGSWAGMVIGPAFILIMIVVFSITKGFSYAINQSALLGIIAMGLSVVVTPLASFIKIGNKKTE